MGPLVKLLENDIKVLLRVLSKDYKTTIKMSSSLCYKQIERSNTIIQKKKIGWGQGFIVIQKLL